MIYLRQRDSKEKANYKMVTALKRCHKPRRMAQMVSAEGV